MTKNIFILSILTILYACGQKNGTVRNTAENLPEQIEISQPDSSVKQSGGSIFGANFHYVVNLKFDKNGITPTLASRQDGATELIVIPTSEMFLTIYQNQKLTHYYDFIDPIGGQPVSGVGTNGSGAIVLPAWILEKDVADAEIGIYRVKNYVSDFSEMVATSENLKQAAGEGIVEKIEMFDAGQAIEMIRGI